ncbi:hypothetical protein EVAR_59402_1 [Eumeta japonica]|uniref:Uncharacterized protein n=1 Tax=Eumeta variegata TaxID=151549 RepID=A0A4C1YMC8_EUMVA|nr:hypothetical protein EVAR_59402_1 [Eumeta japonica]
MERAIIGKGCTASSSVRPVRSRRLWANSEISESLIGRRTTSLVLSEQGFLFRCYRSRRRRRKPSAGGLLRPPFGHPSGADIFSMGHFNTVIGYLDGLWIIDTQTNAICEDLDKICLFNCNQLQERMKHVDPLGRAEKNQADSTVSPYRVTRAFHSNVIARNRFNVPKEISLQNCPEQLSKGSPGSGEGRERRRGTRPEWQF